MLDWDTNFSLVSFSSLITCLHIILWIIIIDNHFWWLRVTKNKSMLLGVCSVIDHR